MSHNESYYIKIIDTLLKNGADPNIKTDDGQTLLYLAAYSENVKCVKTLLDAGANPNLTNDDTCNYTPLTAACEVVNLEMIELLLRAGADPNIHNCETNLEWILDTDYDGPPEKLLVATKLLLDAGYDLNKIDTHGNIETSIFMVIKSFFIYTFYPACSLFCLPSYYILAFTLRSLFTSRLPFFLRTTLASYTLIALK